MTSQDINTIAAVDKQFKIHLTLFRDRHARFKNDKVAALADIANAIRKTTAPTKEALPLLKLARFADMASPKGSLRWDNNVTSVTGCELDYDAGKVSFDDARLLLMEAGICCILYTSPSHTEDHPRWRVLAPFAAARENSLRAVGAARLNGVLCGNAAPESFALSQSYYYGYVDGTDPPRVDVLAGQPIDLRGDLDAGAIGKAGKKAAGNGAGGGAQQFVEFGELIRRITAGEALHPSVLSIAGKCAAMGITMDDCISIIGGAFQAANAERYTDARWNGDVVRTVQDIYRKEQEKNPARDEPLPPGAGDEDFYYDAEGGNYIYTPLMTFWPAKSINAHLPKTNGIKPARWLAEHRAVHQRLWAPGLPRIIEGRHLLEGGEWLGKEGVRSINSYAPPLLGRGKADGAGPWLDLVKRLYPDEKEHSHLIRTFAYKLQHPEVKINHMIILGGGKRIGKDSILEPVKRGVGYRNVAVVFPNMIMGEFNKYAQSVLLHISETRDLGEIKKTTFAEKLKHLVAVPPYVTPVNAKHQNIYSVLNCCLVIATTNHRTDSLYVTEDDGRYFPIWSNVVKEEYRDTPTFFIDFHNWLDHGGIEDTVAYLRTLDVSDYQPKALPPVTDLFLEMVDQSRPVEFDWVGQAIAAMTLDPKRPAPILTFDALAGKVGGEAKQFLETPSKKKFAVFLLEQHGYVKIPSRAKDRCWQMGQIRVTWYGLRSLHPQERERILRAHLDDKGFNQGGN
jgi:hypothetical protein